MSNLFHKSKVKIYGWFGIPEWKACGYTSERAWKRDHDPKIFKSAAIVSHYFCGYPYIVEVPYTPERFDAFLAAYNRSNNYFELFENWAEENNIEGYHFTFLRSAGNDITEFGHDSLFAGFTHEDNAMWFKLRWG
jgi:hypothetical protein